MKVVLTDKYPNAEGWRQVCEQSDHRIDCRTDPIDATAVPDDLRGCRTLFSGFHHFKPDAARGILQDAIDQEVPIGVFEFTERKGTRILGMLLAPMVVLLVTPFIRPRTLGRLFWTYCIPLVPLMYFWDGIVSHLRTYTVDEVRSLTESLARNDYTWEIGGEPSRECDPPITYLLGFPSASGRPGPSPRG